MTPPPIETVSVERVGHTLVFERVENLKVEANACTEPGAYNKGARVNRWKRTSAARS
ncbi:MAG: hypothetical protein M5U26_27130 [Planctomycetota bacterium]|nr:hypothetical protein [Planctomycetota bacterium]